MSLESLKVLLRRALESGDDVTAQALAIQIDTIEGEPVECDEKPTEIPCWGVSV